MESMFTTRWWRLGFALAVMLCVLCSASFFSMGLSETSIAAAAPAKQAANGKPIKIAIVVSQQGGLADSWGIPTMQGAELATSIVNDEGGIKGRPLQLVIRDDKGEIQGTVTAFQELLRDKEIVAFIGPATSGAALAVRPIINQAKIPEFAAVSGSAVATKDFEYFYRVQPSNEIGLKALFRFARTKWQSKSLGVLASTDAAGVEAAGDAVRFAPEYGLTLVANEKYQIGDTDLTPQLTKIKSAGADLLFIFTQGVSTNAVVRNMRQLDMTNIHLIGPNGLADAQAMELAGPLLEGVAYYNFMCADEPKPGLQQQVAERYLARFKRALSPGAIGGFDSIMILRAGLEKVATENSQVDLAALNNTLNTLTVDSAGGVYKITPDWHNGPRADEIQICTVKGGKHIGYGTAR
jgi:branched-chain amino acid transport system substrate-binding protein